MKKYRIITVVLSIVSLLLAGYLLREFWMYSRTLELFFPINMYYHNGFLILLTVLSVAVVIGTASKRNWGRVLTLFQFVLFIVFGVYTIRATIAYITHWGDAWSSLFLYDAFWVAMLWIMYSVAGLIYLTRPNVKSTYKATLVES